MVLCAASPLLAGGAHSACAHDLAHSAACARGGGRSYGTWVNGNLCWDRDRLRRAALEHLVQELVVVAGNPLKT